MKLISEIINDLVDTEKTISSPLLKTKVLASRLKNIDLLKWIDGELNGYDPSGDIPNYRICVANISGTYMNGYTQVNDQPLPLSGLPEELQDSIRQMKFFHSIATLESMKNERNIGILETILPAELTLVIERNIKKKGNPYFQLFKARKYTSISILTDILSIVRSKLLDFMLKIDEEFGNLTEIEELRKKNDVISAIVNQTIVTAGDGSIINTGDNSKIKAKISIEKGNKELLKQRLVENGVSQYDSDELLKIVDLESPDASNGKFGSQVNDWIKKMVGKSLERSWEISIGIAGSLLADLIQSYYGL